MFGEEPAGACLGVIAHSEGGLEVAGLDLVRFLENGKDHGELEQVGSISYKDAVQEADVFLVIEFEIDFFPESIGLRSFI